MARKQGPEEKYYPQGWRFLRRCISPLPTPREGNTFASRNGLSNRFSHMDQPQFLRHRCARIPGDKRDKQHACGYRPERVAGSGETTGPSPGTKMPLPFQAKVKSRIHRFTDRCGKTTESHETAAYEVEYRVGDEFACRAVQSPRQSLGQKKESPAVMTRDNRELNGGRFSRNASRRSRRGNANGPIPSGCIPDTDASRSGGRCCLRIPTGNASLAGRRSSAEGRCHNA